MRDAAATGTLDERIVMVLTPEAAVALRHLLLQHLSCAGVYGNVPIGQTTTTPIDLLAAVRAGLLDREAQM